MALCARSTIARASRRAVLGAQARMRGTCLHAEAVLAGQLCISYISYSYIYYIDTRGVCLQAEAVLAGQLLPRRRHRREPALVLRTPTREPAAPNQTLALT